ncbi:hypothetical protein FIBSPDRAFT_965335 [Athelia psychrophila]|uniref:Uncharacterized protein n=1 Tax=Athelia psychrophila TaxID=1759441 RepID=A0A165WRE9_9AGAM|nr:hypothetical protein FIBSPDRAFT_965335 [Fibularhizoctonia sp. CBS 109695]
MSPGHSELVDIYPDPSTFNPDQFSTGGKLDPSVRHPEAAFGQHLDMVGASVLAGIWRNWGPFALNIGGILMCFNIEIRETRR